MKTLFEEAAALFRQSENSVHNGRSDEERTNCYRGLALLADGLHKLERRMEQLETSSETGRRIVKTLPRRFRAVVFNRPAAAEH